MFKLMTSMKLCRMFQNISLFFFGHRSGSRESLSALWTLCNYCHAKQTKQNKTKMSAEQKSRTGSQRCVGKHPVSHRDRRSLGRLSRSEVTPFWLANTRVAQTRVLVSCAMATRNTEANGGHYENNTGSKSKYLMTMAEKYGVSVFFSFF